MGKQYSQEAIDLCRTLYCKYGGKNYDAIQTEMRKKFPGWSKVNLEDKNAKDRKHQRLGWITKYGFENSLKLHMQKLTEGVNNDEQDLYIGIRNVRKAMQEKVIGQDATKDDIYQYRDFCNLEIAARKNLDLSRDNFETFVAGYEKLVNWLGEIDPEAAKRLIKNGDKLTQMAQAHYGKEEVDDRASDREDEGGK